MNARALINRLISFIYSDFPKLLKKRFGGLKKFIFSHPEFFSREDNHNFNPVVFVVGQGSTFPHNVVVNSQSPVFLFSEAPHPAAPKPSVAPAVPVPVQSQKIDSRKGAVDYAPVPAQQPQPQKQQLQKIPSDPIPLMAMFDDRQSLLLQPRAKSMAISPPKHQPLQQMSQQLHHPPAANHFNHHLQQQQQQPQPHHHYQQPQQQQQYHQQLQRHHDPQQQEYLFPRQEHYGLDRLQHSHSSSAPTFNRGATSSAFGPTAASVQLSQRPNLALLHEPSRAHTTSSQYHLFQDSQFSFFN